jgi:hypothetical protein
MFSLSYLPTAERLTIVIVKARSLKWLDGKDTGGQLITRLVHQQQCLLSDCCVKVFLIQNGKRAGKKRTSMKKDQPNPIFNEAMIFSVPSSSLSVSFRSLKIFLCLTYCMENFLIFSFIFL